MGLEVVKNVIYELYHDIEDSNPQIRARHKGINMW